MTKQKPEVGNEISVEVKGYGCDDDCREYYPSTSSLGCGWKPSPKDNDWW